MASSLFLLLPISLVFVVAIGVFFWWAIFAGQFDDAQSGGDAILLDQDTPIEDISGLISHEEKKAARPEAISR